MAAKKTEAAKPAARKRTTRRKLVPTHERIAERAYFLHLEAGGGELENWLRAERELQAV